MRYALLLSILVAYTGLLSAQKPPIDSSVYGKWPSVGSGAISNDGKFAMYVISNQPVGSQTFVLHATGTDWKLEIPGGAAVSLYRFTQDSRVAFFTRPKDSLGIVHLGTPTVEYIPHVRSFKLPKKGTGEWLAYLTNEPAKELVVRDLITGKQQSFADVTDYTFSNDGAILLLVTGSMKDSVRLQTLNWVSLPEGRLTTIWQGTRAANIVFDDAGTQLAFLTQDKINNRGGNSLWYYKGGTEKAIQLAGDHSPGIDNGLYLNGIDAFTRDGGRLFLDLKEREYPRAKAGAVQVDVWNYRDTKLQSQQLAELNLRAITSEGHPRSFKAVININDHQVIRLEKEDELIFPFRAFDERANDIVLVKGVKGDESEDNWNANALPYFYLVSTRDGMRKQVNNGNRTVRNYYLSAGGKYLVYYDAIKKDYFSYEVASGITRDITKGLPINWTIDDDRPESTYENIRVGGWMKNDEAVLLYDRYDIWKVNLRRKGASLCITNGYGRKHHIVFRLGMKDYEDEVISGDQRLILLTLNKNTKDNGFYSKVIGEKGDPQPLTMGPYVYYTSMASGTVAGYSPQKAKDEEVYLVKRESVGESPNYFATKDLKTLIPLSDIHPEKEYNWLTSELYTWKTEEGESLQGVLYKPENFDPKRKYPIIFVYYERLSDEKNVYRAPEATTGRLQIPWFVSNGYLVFTPDIHHKTGRPGESALHSVVSAARYLSTMPWVDAHKMGITSHSLGGFETDYLVTHTHLFAAAISGAGISDCISGFGYYWEFGPSMNGLFERGQMRIGASLWQRPDLYIANSAIFSADKVTTPLLLMNNKNDGAVPFAQGVEFFTALRRLGKKVWMLQYDAGNHVVFGKAADDYSIRTAQFFDHYLKGAPAPKWMVEGVPARMKGIDTGLELDRSGREP